MEEEYRRGCLCCIKEKIRGLYERLSLLHEREWRKIIGKVVFVAPKRLRRITYMQGVFVAPKRVEEDYLYKRLFCCVKEN